jgi:hypothetical protein
MTITPITTAPYEGSILGTWTVPGGDAGSADATGADGTTPDVVNADPIDSIHLSQIQFGGSFTTEAGDSYRIADLFKITQAEGEKIHDVGVAIRGAGTLTLNGVDVTNQLNFTEDQFKSLILNVGTTIGDTTDIVLAALTSHGSSPAMEITADVTGTRSINAAPALYQQDNFTFVAQRASLLRGYFADQDPGLTTAGNFTGEASDRFRVADLFRIKQADAASIASVDVAVRGVGTLLLDGVDVAGRTSFTEDEFKRLQFELGTTTGDSADLVVAATTKKGASQALEITAEATGTRSLNAAPALYQQDAFTFVAQVAALLGGYFPESDPGLSTVGNFTSEATDTFRLSDVFDITAPKIGTILHVDVVLRGTGTLLLDGVDVTSDTDFTADEFKRLQFHAGSTLGDSADIVVAARTSKGASPAESVTATVTGARSINAAMALYEQDNFTFVAQRAGLLRGYFPASDPALATIGNFTGQVGDLYKVSDLFDVTQAKDRSVLASVDVALRGVGTLLLDGVDVAGRTSFTADEFNRLQLELGATLGDAADLVVAATTKKGASQALALTATAAAKRSLNAAPALYQQDSYSFVAQRAFLLQGFLPDWDPKLTTAGNFTGAVGDTYRLSDLFRIGQAKSGPIASVDVAVRGPGTLTLDGVDVTARTSFTEDEFHRLSFSAGSALNDETDIVVAATTKKGSSPAMQITAAITGTRSINSAAGLYQQDNFTFVAQRAFLMRGYFPDKDPDLSAIGRISAGSLSASALATAPGAFIGSNLKFDSHSSFNYAALFANAIGAYDLSGVADSDIRQQLFEVLSLGGSTVGGVQLSSRTSALSSFAILAYLQAMKLR